MDIDKRELDAWITREPEDSKDCKACILADGCNGEICCIDKIVEQGWLNPEQVQNLFREIDRKMDTDEGMQVNQKWYAELKHRYLNPAKYLKEK